MNDWAIGFFVGYLLAVVNIIVVNILRGYITAKRKASR